MFWSLYLRPENLFLFMILEHMSYSFTVKCMCRREERCIKGKPEGKRLFVRIRSRWEDNIKIDLQDVGWGAWTGLIWLRIGGRLL